MIIEVQKYLKLQEQRYDYMKEENKHSPLPGNSNQKQCFIIFELKTFYSLPSFCLLGLFAQFLNHTTPSNNNQIYKN